jgi:hypothetical protein
LGKHKPWIDEECSKFLDQWKQAKLQWLQNLSDINVDNLNNVSRETSRHFRYNKREHLVDKMKALATDSNDKNNRDFQPRSSLVNYESDYLLANYHNILNSEGTTFLGYCMHIAQWL